MGILKKEKKPTSPPVSTSPCAHLRAAYYNCFNRWYSEKFVKGQWDKEECTSEWEDYRACLTEHADDKHLSRFLKADGVMNSFMQTDFGKTDGAAASTGAAQ